MLKGRLMTCPGEVEVVVHDPISTNGLGRKDVRALAAQAQVVIEKTVAARDSITSVDSPPDAAAAECSGTFTTGC